MINKKIKKVIIAGGGTAGWMAAAALSKLLGKTIEVNLVESDEIPTVGVGEATIPTLHVFHRLLGINEQEFMTATNATFKLGISFENWRDVGKDYIHSFGYLDKGCWAAGFHHFWLKGRQLGIAADFGDYIAEHLAAREGKFAVLPNQENNHAYHLDAGLYAKFLREIAEKHGCTRIEGKISKVNLNKEDGFINSLTLASGQMVAGDLFLDCTGFKGLLIEQALHTGYEDWSHLLPCDSAIAVQTTTVGNPVPYTRSIARDAGWQWRIPLQNRTGNGLVFCSKYMSDDEAKQVLLDNIEGELLNEPRVIKYKTGTRRKHWNKNCIAVGLSSGFIEPLESTGIHLFQKAILRLMLMFPANGIVQEEVDEFNKQTKTEIDYIKDFIILHYNLTDRRDTPFWRYCSSMPIPETLSHKMALFKKSGKLFESSGDLFGESSWIQVMLGQGLMPDQYHPIVDLMTDNALAGFLNNIKTTVKRKVDNWPNHNDFIEHYCKAKVSLAEHKPMVSQVITIGHEKTPVIIIDDFIINSKNVIDYACNKAVFNTVQDSYYPGVRSTLPNLYVKQVLQAVAQEISQVYQLPTGLKLKPLQVYYSLITSLEKDLKLLQRIPHFDSLEPCHFALLHYLNDKPHGNTGFYRHLPTGYESINQSRVEPYLKLSKEFIKKNGEPSQHYIKTSNEHYELYHEIEYKPNRLIIYPGNLLHSTVICSETDIDADPATGRLTANIFLEFN